MEPVQTPPSRKKMLLLFGGVFAALLLAVLVASRDGSFFGANVIPDGGPSGGGSSDVGQMCTGEMQLIAQDTATVHLNGTTQGADLAITKETPQMPEPYLPGATVEYTLTYQNNGPQNVTDGLIVDTYDKQKLENIQITYPEQQTCTVDANLGQIRCENLDIPTGVRRLMQIRYTAQVKAGANGLATNTVVISSPSIDDPTPENNVSSATIPIGTLNADVAITKSVSPQSVSVGAQATYTLHYQNNGPTTVNGATIVDDYDQTRISVDLGLYAGICQDNGDTITCQIPEVGLCIDTTNGGICIEGINAPGSGGNIAYTATALATGTAHNTATISTSVPDSNPSNNSASANLVIGGGSNPPTCSNFIATPNPVGINKPFTLTWNSTQQVGGKIVANGVILYSLTTETSQPIDEGIDQDTTYVLNVFSASGATAQCSVTVTVRDEIQKSKVVSVNGGPKVTNANADATDTLVYTLTIKNVSNQTITNYLMEDDISDILKYAEVTAVSDGGTLGADEVVRWTIPSIAPNASVERTFTAKVYPTNLWPNDDFKMENEFGNRVVVNLPPPPSEIDTKIEKAADSATTIAGDEVVYTLTYENLGPAVATNTVITDDFNENKVELVSFPQPLCSAVEANGVAVSLLCNVGTLEIDGPHTLQYTVRVKQNATGNIVNTARITQDEVDGNLANNEDTATVTITATGELTITKRANPTSLVHGQEVIYTIRVTNNSNQAEDFSINDTITNISNEGKITNIQIVSTTFSSPTSGPLTGSYPDFHIAHLEAGEYVEIVYRGQADVTKIPSNKTSNITNTAKIVETGATATATVTLKAPCTSNCGGGGGGGGGSRRLRLQLDLNKEVFDGKQWQDADTFPMAQLLKSQKQQSVPYRIVIKNLGQLKAENVEIEDVFESSSMERKDIRKVEGADWDENDNIFSIDKINSGATATISYEALIIRKVGAKELASGVNVATILSADSTKPTTTTRIDAPIGIGKTDPVFVRLGDIPQEIDVTLTKRVDKTIVGPGEDVVYTIMLKNISKEDLKDVVLKDRFPFSFLEYVNANMRGIERDGTVEFRKRILRPNETWVIRVNAKVKTTVANNTKIRNFVTVSASNADLSDKNASTEITVNRQPQPNRLQQTGGEGVALALMLLGASVLFWSWKKRLSF